MVSNNGSNPSEFVYVDDDMAPDAHYWAENVEGTKDIAILPREAFTWFQDPKFAEDLIKATDERWDNPMGKDIILIESLARNDADIRATIARLQQTADRNKALAYTTLSAINNRTRMRKFNRVIEKRRQVSKKPPVSPTSSQPFISAPSTPPPLTRDASRTSSTPSPTKSTPPRYAPYTVDRRPIPPDTFSIRPEATTAIYKEMEKLITPALAYKLKSAGKIANPVRREFASQKRLAEINAALQDSQKKPISTSIQPTATPSSSRRTQSAGLLPAQTETHRPTNKGKNVVRKHPYPNDVKCYCCGKQGHYSQDCLDRKCRWCDNTGHFPRDCTKHPRVLEEERRNNFHDTADREDHWDEDAKANITGEPYRN